MIMVSVIVVDRVIIVDLVVKDELVLLDFGGDLGIEVVGVVGDFGIILLFVGVVV